MPNVQTRFESKYRADIDCWEWQAAKTKSGYGMIRVDGQMKRAHRVAYELFVGPIGDKQVLHICDNPGCVNPSHLFLGTIQDNVDDMVSKGRARGNAKLSTEEVRDIWHSRDTIEELAITYGVTKSQIYAIKSGRYWKRLTQESNKCKIDTI